MRWLWWGWWFLSFDQHPGTACAFLIAPATSYRIEAYQQAARRLGVNLMLVSQGELSMLPNDERGVSIDFSAPDVAIERICEAARLVPPCAVLATDDSTVELAALVARKLGLVHNSPHASRISRRKDLARQVLADAGLPVPSWRRVCIHRPLEPQLVGVRYPVVVKPLALAGSCGVIRANNLGELTRACRRVHPLVRHCTDSEERSQLVVEDFIPGVEIALEGLLCNGELHVLAVFDKPDPLDGPYFAETYYVTPSRLPTPMQELVRTRVAQACRAYGLHHGPIHAELRLWDQEAWLLELAARTIGGECARLLRFGSGASLEELVLANAVGQSVEKSRGDGAAGVMMVPVHEAGCLRRVEGVLQARRVTFVQDVVISVREGYELVPLPEGSSYLGFIFAQGPSAETVENALREAFAKLRVVTAPVWHIAPPRRGQSVDATFSSPT